MRARVDSRAADSRCFAADAGVECRNERIECREEVRVRSGCHGCHAAIEDPSIDAVVIATRHDSHAELVLKALEAGKHVFVEKPLAITSDELQSIDDVYRALDGYAPESLRLDSIEEWLRMWSRSGACWRLPPSLHQSW